MSSLIQRIRTDEELKKDLTFTIVLFIIIGGAFLGFNYGLKIVLNTDTPIVVVEGRSMEPTFYEGDLLIVKGIPPEEIENGSIIVFWAEWRNALIVHRVIAIDNSSGELLFYTQGDNRETNPLPDPYPTPAKNVKGVVIFSIPKIGLISIMLREYGLIIPVMAILIFLILQTLFSSESNKTKEKKKLQSTAFLKLFY